MRYVNQFATWLLESEITEATLLESILTTELTSLAGITEKEQTPKKFFYVKKPQAKGLIPGRAYDIMNAVPVRSKYAVHE